jgi:hypothetical protein
LVSWSISCDGSFANWDGVITLWHHSHSDLRLRLLGLNVRSCIRTI